MTTKFSILIGILLIRFFLFGGDDTDHQPMRMIDGWDLSGGLSQEVAFTLTDDSTLVEYEVVLLEDEEKIPVAYTSYITTPVCDDTLCALMHIRMYWNLLGNYIGFDTIEGMPLTKNDHLEFKEEDYTKLHHLLMDDHSIIKRKEKKDLFDNDEMRVSEVVDAVTGATAKEVKEAVVDGALYSSYTIYHIVYGALSDSIRSDMEQRYNSSVQNKLLSSAYPDYQLYALKKLDKGLFTDHVDRILELIYQSIPLNRLYIMKKMPDEMWINEKVQETISGYCADIDVNSISYFLKEMVSVKSISSRTIWNLISNLEHMSLNQMKSLVRILSNQTKGLPEGVMDFLEKKIENKEITYAYLWEEFLQGVNTEDVIEN